MTTPPTTRWTCRLQDVAGCPTATAATPEEAVRQAAQAAGIDPQQLEISGPDSQGYRSVGLGIAVIGQVYPD